MIFIVSTGRSGSKSITQILSRISGCTCKHEPPPELILETSGYRYGEVNARHIETMLMETRLVNADRDLYCESNQTLSLIIPILATTFPEARFIWLIRNGLDQVASAYAKQWYSGHSENFDRYEDSPPLERTWINGRVEGDRCGDLSRDLWENLDRFGKCCWYWTYVNRVIESDLSHLDKRRFAIVKLEELATSLPTLITWMGFPNSPLPRVTRTNRGKREPYPWYNWSLEHRYAFNSWCSDLMDKYYPTWRDANNNWIGVTSDARPSGRTYKDIYWNLLMKVKKLYSSYTF